MRICQSCTNVAVARNGPYLVAIVDCTHVGSALAFDRSVQFVKNKTA